MPDFCSYFRIETDEDITLSIYDKGGYRKWDRWQKTVTKDTEKEAFPGKLLDGKAGTSKGSDGWIKYKSDDGVIFTFRLECPVGTYVNKGSYTIENDPDNKYAVDAKYNSGSSSTERFELRMPDNGHPVHGVFKIRKN